MPAAIKAPTLRAALALTMDGVDARMLPIAEPGPTEETFISMSSGSAPRRNSTSRAIPISNRNSATGPALLAGGAARTSEGKEAIPECAVIELPRLNHMNLLGHAFTIHFRTADALAGTQMEAKNPCVSSAVGTVAELQLHKATAVCTHNDVSSRGRAALVQRTFGYA
eukprot:CAMPEP_0180628328 /NCGR_PEP_ID=MMETSP1037_2-20121125/38869_1 /TAXON_ID=632150 /ORGANISM="Azadinium spinosum, Strain 3D9" /LENGTH=167 /DNA_ID=CAMNT_0022649055 /DNA_START=3 /DNA_END=505 /DNA_ORIENTATION=+